MTLSDTPAPARTPYAARILDWSDERRAGDGIIVTLANGWAFEPSTDANSACHVRGYDTVTEARRAGAEAKPCTCGRCVPVQAPAAEALPVSHPDSPYVELTETDPNAIAWEAVQVATEGPQKGLPLPARALDNVRWFARHDVPAIGERVRLTYNGLGFGKVAGYFTEGGFLGLLIDLETPTDRGSRAHAFGSEFEPLTMAQPVQQQQARAARPAPVAVATFETSPRGGNEPYRTPNYTGQGSHHWSIRGTVFEDRAAGLDGKRYDVAVYQDGLDWAKSVTLDVAIYDATGRMLPETHKPAIRAAALETYRAIFLTPEAIEASRNAHVAAVVEKLDFEGLQALAAGNHPTLGNIRYQDAAKARIAALKAIPVLTPTPEAAAPVQDAPARRAAGTIDMTPTWRDILPYLLLGYTEGNAEGRAIALEELQRMATLADERNTITAATR